MRKSLLLLVAVLISVSALAQNPYEEFDGKKYEVLTLSNGKFKEIFDEDSIVQIGTVLFNTNSNQIVAFLKQDIGFSDALLRPEVNTRFLSLDPLARKYPMLSPYVYTADNPIFFIDPDGRAVSGFAVGQDGQVQITGRASESAIKIFQAMSKTTTGSDQFKKMVEVDTKITLKLTDKELSNGAHGQTLGHGDDGHGLYKSATVTISTSKSDDRFQGVSDEELINVVGSHESVHAADAEQKVKDTNQPNSWETERKPIETEYKSADEYENQYKPSNTIDKSAYDLPSDAKDPYGNTKPIYKLNKTDSQNVPK